MDPTLELVGAVIARLKASAAVSAIVGDRVHDSPPPNYPYPHISIGPSSYQSDDADCLTSGEIMVQIDAWSDQGSTKSEVRRMADAIRAALRGWHPTLMTNALVTLDHWRTDYLRDGEIQHASVRFTAIIEQP